MSGRHRTARRRMPLGEHFFWTIVAAVALVTAGLTVWFAAQAGGQPAANAASPTVLASCVWDDELTRTLAELGEHPGNWTITDLDGGYLGRARLDEDRALIDRDTPCDYVSSVVKHEWMHLQQGRKFGGKRAAYAAYGGSADRLELVADCGSMLLGARHTPFVDDQGGCSDADRAAARALIDFTPSDTLTQTGTK